MRLFYHTRARKPTRINKINTKTNDSAAEYIIPLVGYGTILFPIILTMRVLFADYRDNGPGPDWEDDRDEDDL